MFLPEERILAVFQGELSEALGLTECWNHKMADNFNNDLIIDNVYD